MKSVFNNLFVLELANNHWGSLERGKEIVKSFAKVVKNNNVKAPMPGLVLRIIAQEGDTVKKGDALLVLEAMKMENVIKAEGEGTIKRIAVAPKQVVEKNTLLVEMEG